MIGLEGVAKLLLIAGAAIIFVGLFFLLASKMPFFGRLPGDIVIRRGNFSLFFPLVTCIILTIIITIGLNLLGWLFRK